MSSLHRSLYAHTPPFLLRRRASFPPSPELKHHFIPPTPSSSSSSYYLYEEDEPQSPIDQNPFRFFVSPPTPPDEMELDDIEIENDDAGDDLSAGIEGAATSKRRGAYFDMPRQTHDIGSSNRNRDGTTRANKRSGVKHVSFLLGPDEDSLPPSSSSSTATANAINATYTDIIAFPPRPLPAERGRSRRRPSAVGGERRCRTHSDRRRSWVRPDWRLGMISESEEEEGDTEEEEGGSREGSKVDVRAGRRG